MRFALALLLAAGCHAAAPRAKLRSPAALEGARLLAREAKGLRPFDVRGESSALSVEASAKPTLKSGHLVVPIGEGAEIHCSIYRRALPPSIVLADVLGKLGGKDTRRHVVDSDAGALAGSPFVQATVELALERGGKRRVGLIKAIAIKRRQDGLACLHDQPGFQRTFVRTAEQIARTLVTTLDAGAQPRYREVGRLELHGRRAGFQEITIFDAPDGGTVYYEALSLLGGSRGSVSGYDHLIEERSDAGGELEAGTYLTLGAVDQPTCIVRVERDGDRHRARGRCGAPVDAVLDATRPFLSKAFYARRVREVLLQGAGGELRFEFYAPWRHPDRMVKNWVRPSAGGAFPFLIDEGAAAAGLEFDARGSLIRFSAPGTLRYERVHHEGEVP